MKEQFAARATEVGADVHLVPGAEDAVEKAAQILASRRAVLVVVSPDLGAIAGKVEQVLTGKGIRLLGTTAGTWDVEKADAGVTGAALGVAETGSLLLEGNDLFPRLATMLPFLHIVLIGEKALVPSLDEVGEHIRRSALAEGGEQVRYASLVTGPSRTADVEKTLSTGVHGPGELHIIVFSQP